MKLSVKKFSKKSLSLLIALIMVFSAMPFSPLSSPIEANAAEVKKNIDVWDAANVTAATPGTGTKFVYTDTTTTVTINGVHYGSANKDNGSGYVTFNNATISSEIGFASRNIKGDVWTFSSKFAITGTGKDNENVQQTANDASTIFGIGTSDTHTYSPNNAAKTSGMAADLVNITKNGNIYLAGSSESSGTVANVLSSSADDAKILTVAYDNGNLTISLNGTTAYTGTVDPALFSKGVANFFIGTSAQIYQGGTAPYYGLTNNGYYTYGTHLYSLSGSVSYDPTNVPPSESAQTTYNNINSMKTEYSTLNINNAGTDYMRGIISGTNWGGHVEEEFTYEGNNKNKYRIHSLTNSVALYTGEDSVRIPVVFENPGQSPQSNVTSLLGFDYVALNGVNNFTLGNSTWTRINGWTDFTNNSDSSYSFSSSSQTDVARATSFSEDSGTDVATSDRFDQNSSKLWKNYIKYTGNNLTTYYDKISAPNFTSRADYAIYYRSRYQAFYGWHYAWSYKTDNRQVKSGVNVYVLNFAPLLNIMNSSDFKTNFETIYNNRWMYDDTARENYFDVMADITTFDLSTRAMTTEDEVRAVATEIKGMVERYKQYKSPSLLGNIVTFVNANGDTVESRLVKDGNAIGAFPKNTGVKGGITGYEGIHYTYTWDTTLTAESTVDADVIIREKENGANCSGGEATCKSKATCSVCGYKYGSLKEHSYKLETDYQVPSEFEENAYKRSLCIYNCGTEDINGRVYMDVSSYWEDYNAQFIKSKDEIANTAKYTPDSIKAVQDIIDEVAPVKDSPTKSQGYIQAKTNALMTATTNLVLRQYSITVNYVDENSNDLGTETITNVDYGTIENVTAKTKFDNKSYVVYKWTRLDKNGDKLFGLNSTSVSVNVVGDLTYYVHLKSTQAESPNNTAVVTLNNKAGKPVDVGYVTTNEPQDVVVNDNTISIGTTTTLTAPQYSFYSVKGFIVNNERITAGSGKKSITVTKDMTIIPLYSPTSYVNITRKSDETFTINGKDIGSYSARWDELITLEATGEVIWYTTKNNKDVVLGQGRIFKFRANEEIEIYTKQEDASLTPNSRVGYFGYDADLKKVTIVNNFFVPGRANENVKAGVVVSTKAKTRDEMIAQYNAGSLKFEGGYDKFTADKNQIRITINRNGTGTSDFSMWALSYVIVNGTTYFADDVISYTYNSPSKTA